MPVILTILINYTVNYLLLLGTARLCQWEAPLWRMLLAAGVGALHALVCLLPGLGFMGHAFWRLISMPVMGIAAFGIGRQQLRLYAALILLCLVLDGATGKGIPTVLCGLLLLFLLFVSGRGQGGTVPVALQYAGNELELTALRDTGNCLRDPVSGTSVLVIGAEAAKKLTGLTVQQLKKPLETIGVIPGLRLIPYKAVGSSGFLLAMKLPKVRIGTWQGSHVVAFAPEGLEGNAGYEALVGGSV